MVAVLLQLLAGIPVMKSDNQIPIHLSFIELQSVYYTMKLVCTR